MVELTFEDIIKTLEEKASQQENAVVSEAKARARQVMQDAEKEAKSLVEQGRLEGKELGEEARGEISANTRLREKRVKAEAREKAVDDALAEAEKKVKQFANAPEYGKLLAGLAANCVELLGKDSELTCRKKDEPKLKGFNVAGNADVAGGVIGRSKDHRIKVDNSLEALFSLHREKLKQTAYHELFGSREPPAANRAAPGLKPGKTRKKEKKGKKIK